MKNERNHIAIFLPSLRGGGAERVMLTLANAIAERGYRVDLVLAKAEGPHLNDIGHGVEIVDLDASRVFLSLPGLVRYLRRENPPVLLSAMSHANVIALLARRLSGKNIRTVVSERSTPSASRSTMWRAKLVSPLMRFMYPFADGITAVSFGVARDLAATIGIAIDRIDVIYNPVYTQRLITLSNDEVEHPWLLDPAVPVILSVGRFTLAKDYPTLIKAFEIIRKHREAKLIILGEGELRMTLERQIAQAGLSEDVYLPGFVENPYKWMRHATLFVLSSAWEGLPAVLIEAMACETPVVSTDCPNGPAEILENGKYGRLVPVGNYKALAGAIDKTLNEGGDLNVKRRAEEFSLQKAVDAYLKILLRRDDVHSAN
jgi:glycosyltransferase involved in cell wall biosynthesis